ncbi:MAG: hypothetical protein ABJE47_03195 [bacterium]
MSIPSRQDRLVDLAALLLILAGAVACVVASGQLHEISQLSYQHPGPRTISQLTAADHARYLAYAGVLVIGVGIGVAVAGAIRVSRRKRVIVS